MSPRDPSCGENNSVIFKINNRLAHPNFRFSQVRHDKKGQASLLNLQMRPTLPVLVATLVRRDQEKAVDAFELLMSVRESARRMEVKINATSVTINPVQIMFNIFQQQCRSLELYSQFGAKRGARMHGIRLCEVKY